MWRLKTSRATSPDARSIRAEVLENPREVVAHRLEVTPHGAAVQPVDEQPEPQVQGERGRPYARRALAAQHEERGAAEERRDVPPADRREKVNLIVEALEFDRAELPRRRTG